MTETPSKEEKLASQAFGVEWKPFIRAGGITIFVMGLLFAATGGLAPSIINIPFAPSVQSALQALNANAYSWEVVWLVGGVVDVLLLVVFTALYVAVKRSSAGLSIVSLIFLVVSIAIDLAADIPLRYSIVGIANSYASATSEAQQSAYLATAQLVQNFSGIVALLSTLILAVATVLISVAMVRSKMFGRWAGYIGIVAGITRWPASIWFYNQTPGIPYQLGFAMLGLTSLTYILWAILAGYKLYKLGSFR